MADLTEVLRRLLPQEAILPQEDVLAWSGGKGTPGAVVAPGSEEEVAAVLEELESEAIFLREVGQDSQLDLGVVRSHEAPALVGNESRPDLAACVAARRDVLKIRIGGGQASGRGTGRMIRSVNATGLRVHQSGQGVDVGAL